jgi:alkylation response protein AidB-like acyl-CoA dehydrogenase
LDGAQADLLLTLARKPDGDLILLAIDARQTAVIIEELPTLDMTRRLAGVQYIDAVGDVVAEGEALRHALDRMLDIAAVALACEQVGGASRALEMTVEYAKIRTQFDALIGSFQAIKFKCADMLLNVEAARSAAYYAVAALDNDNADFQLAASAAKAVCSESYMSVSSEMIQIHGGIGYTWEHDAHLFFKRAKASQILFGDAEEHRERLADRLGI